MNRVNIILATYNGEKYIREQLESIVQCNYKNWKLWIFDDGSNDDTHCIIEEYICKYPDKISFHRNTGNKGVTRNFLEGVQIAAEQNGRIREESDTFGEDTISVSDDDSEPQKIIDYYMFCDQDDVWMTDKIDKTMMHMKKEEKKHGENTPVAVFTDALVVDNDLNVLYRSFHKCNNLDTKKVDLPHIMMENKLIGCTIMFNESLRKIMCVQPDNARYHDWWVAMIAAAFGRISYLPAVTLFYRQHGGNVVGNQNFFTYVNDRLSSLQQQKEVIYKTALQAGEFYNMYEADMPARVKKQVYLMANMFDHSWFMRRHLVLKFGFMKTGVLRNLGLLIVL